MYDRYYLKESMMSKNKNFQNKIKNKISYTGAARLGGGGKGVPRSAFEESFLRFLEKVRLKFSPISGENSSKIQ
jgi:hypothetical protein